MDCYDRLRYIYQTLDMDMVNRMLAISVEHQCHVFGANFLAEEEREMESDKEREDFIPVINNVKLINDDYGEESFVVSISMIVIVIKLNYKK